jgi:hypothetical protein
MISPVSFVLIWDEFDKKSPTVTLPPEKKQTQPKQKNQPRGRYGNLLRVSLAWIGKPINPPRRTPQLIHNSRPFPQY